MRIGEAHGFCLEKYVFEKVMGDDAMSRRMLLLADDELLIRRLVKLIRRERVSRRCWQRMGPMLRADYERTAGGNHFGYHDAGN
jgi:hypothetical protein